MARRKRQRRGFISRIGLFGPKEVRRSAARVTRAGMGAIRRGDPTRPARELARIATGKGHARRRHLFGLPRWLR